MARPTEAVWYEVLKELRTRLGSRRFDLWLANITPVDSPPIDSALLASAHADLAEGETADSAGVAVIASDEIVLAVPSIFVKQWIQDRFLKDIEASFDAIASRRAGEINASDQDPPFRAVVRLVVDPQAATPPLAATGAVTSQSEVAEDPGTGADSSERRHVRHVPQGRVAAGRAMISGRMQPSLPLPDEGTPLCERFTVERFVPGRANMIAYRSAVDVVRQPGRIYNPLFIYGESGLGKTHLLQAIAWEFKRSGARVMHTGCEEFVNQFVYAVSTRDSHNLRKTRESIRAADVFLFDDAQLLRNKSATQEEFLHCFDVLANMDKQIIITADCSPHAIKRLKRELVTRFMSGMVARIDPPDLELKFAILCRKAAEMTTTFTDGVLRYLASAPVASVRELEGLLIQVGAHASLEGERVDVPMARAALADALGARQQPINLRSIEEAIVEYFKITPEELRSHKRRKSITFPRQVGMYMARTLTTCSLQEIGNYFGGKNHATVLFAERKITAARQDDPMVDEVCQQMMSRFQRHPNPS